MFLLIDQETDRHFKNKRIALVSSLATVKHLPYKPRIAELTKGSDGYGFYLRKEPKMSGELWDGPLAHWHFSCLPDV